MSAEIFLGLAKELVLANILDSAQSIYDFVLHQDPANCIARHGLARIHIARGDYAGALPLLQASIDGCPPGVLAAVWEDIADIHDKYRKIQDSTEAWYRAGVDYLNIGWVDRAANAFWKAMQLNSNDDNIREMLIESLGKSTQIADKILSEYNNIALENDPFVSVEVENFSLQDMIPFYIDAYLAYANGDSLTALSHLNDMPKKNPEYWQLKIFYLQADCHRARGDIESATPIERRVIDLMLSQKQLSEALSYAHNRKIKINWRSALEKIQALSNHYSWWRESINLITSQNDVAGQFTKLWQELYFDWQKSLAGEIVSVLIPMASFSKYYKPSLSPHLFNLSDGWHPQEKQIFMLENAIFGHLHGDIPDFEAAHALVGRWWNRHLALGTPYVKQCQFPETTRIDQPLRIGMIDITGMCTFPHYYNGIVAPAFKSLSKEKFTTFLYCNTREKLPSYLQDQNFTARQVDCASPSTINIIANDNLDVLLLINGFVAGIWVPLFAARPARRMAMWMHTYCGYGPDLFDASILDKVIHTSFHDKILDVPVVLTQGWMVLLEPHKDAPPILAAPRLSKGHVTFGIFNRPSKITNHMAGLWSAILKRLPNSRLVFASNYLAIPSQKDGLIAQMIAADIDQDRIEILPTESDYINRLAQHSHIDIALDTYPFTGGMTTVEALWQGVPIITRADETPLARSGLAILSPIGLADLAAFDDETYIDIAVALAQDGPRLDQLRADLRGRMQRSVLMDAGRYADDFERVMREVLALPARGVQAPPETAPQA